MKIPAKDLPPGPFALDQKSRHIAYVTDATGKKIVTLLGTAKVKYAVAALLIEARNSLRPRTTANPVPPLSTGEPVDG